MISKIRGYDALQLFVQLVSGPVLDIGSGSGTHAAIMDGLGLDVYTLDPHLPADIKSAWPPPFEFTHPFGGIWACHVLEHSRNPGAFLDACRTALAPGGWLCVTVPPAKNAIVGGHVSIWNAGLLLYHLVLAGFDCTMAKVKTYGYNISVIVQRQDFDLPDLVNDEGDIETLAPWLPPGAGQSFDGRIAELNWRAE